MYKAHFLSLSSPRSLLYLLKEKLQTNFCYDSLFTSFLVRRRQAFFFLKFIMSSVVAHHLKHAQATSPLRQRFKHSVFHHSLGKAGKHEDVLGIKACAASIKADISYEATTSIHGYASFLVLRLLAAYKIPKLPLAAAVICSMGTTAVHVLCCF